MGISTYSGFTYGHTITTNNQNIDFAEGLGELTAAIPIGSYSLGDFVLAVAEAMNLVGGFSYAASVDRSTRKITLSASGSFELLVTTGTNVATSAFPLMGFTTDRSPNPVHGSNDASGEFYTPQNLLQRFTDFQDNIKTINPSVRQTASGLVEVVSYGTVPFMECMIMPITDVTPQLSIISNANAVSEFRDFMNYCITKAPIEFVPNVLIPNTFQKCILESTPESSSGVDFKIKENKKLFNWYESGALTFRGL